VLAEVRKRLLRRDIVAAACSRWAGPRAQLRTVQAWQAKRGSLVGSLHLPGGPGGLVGECAAELAAAGRHVAARAAAGDITVDAGVACMPPRCGRSPARRRWPACVIAARR
jgi:hypothetical protein